MIKKTRRIKENIMARELHKHPFAVPIFTLFVLSFVTMVSMVLFGAQAVRPTDSHIVQLTIDGKKQVLPTRAGTVGELLERAEVTLHEGDIVEPAQETKIDVNDFRVNVYRARPVAIIDGDRIIQAFSAATTPRSVAVQSGVEVFPEDVIDQKVSNDILRDQILGEKIVITRAVPTNLNLYGTPVTVRTHAKTVRELLREKNIKLSSSDTVMPAPDALITGNIQIFVTRVGTQIATVEEAVAMETEYIEDKTLSFGTQAVRQVGAPGKKLVTYQLELENGREISRKLIQEVVTQAPVKQIIARGRAVSIPTDRIAIMRAAGVAESDYPYASYIIDHENASWCPTRYQGTNGCPAYYVEKFPGAESHTSTGYGLCQATPGNKMATAGSDWRTNPVTQMRWCHDYAIRRYKTWQAAYEFKRANGWW